MVASNISKKITKKKSDIKTFKRLKNIKQNNIYIYTHTIEKYKRKMCYTQKNNLLQNIYDKL